MIDRPIPGHSRGSAPAFRRPVNRPQLARAAAFALGAALAGQSSLAQVIVSQWNTGNGNWNVATNWAPQDVPDNFSTFTYDVQIGNLPVAAGAQVTFVPEDGTADTIGNLTMSGGADLSTNGFQLNVTGLTTLTGITSALNVGPHATPGTASLVSLDLDVTGGGLLLLAGGIASVSSDLDVTATGILQGFGTLNVGDADAVVEQAFQNSGLVQVVGNSGAPSVLVLHANGVDTIDLDGDSESGIVSASNALANANQDTLTLIVDGPLTDSFGAVAGASIQIGQRDTITFNQDWGITTGTTLTMNGGALTATLNGPGNITAISGATISVTGGTAIIDSNMTFSGTANVISIAAGSTLTLNGTVSIPDASALSFASSTARLVVGGAVTVNDAAGDFNWDGPGTATTNIEAGGNLSLTVNRVDTTDDIYGGTVNLNDGGDLSVNNVANAWTLAGTMNKNGTGTSVVSGDRMLVTGNVVVNSATLDLPAVTFQAGSDVTVSGTLTMGGGTELAGPATFAGTGVARMEGNSSVSANTIVTINTWDWDGASVGGTHTINDGIVFTINSPVIDTDGDVDDVVSLGGNGAQLIVNGPTQWTQTNTFNANTALAGTATVGGTSRVIFTSTLNVDGNTNISAPVTFGAGSFFGDIDTGATLNITGTTATYAGGTMDGLGTFEPAATNTVTGTFSMNVDLFNFDGGNWVVNSGAALITNVVDYEPVAATNSFETTLTINNGLVNINTADAEFVMNGTANLNASGGTGAEWSGDPVDIGNDAGALDANLNVTGDGNPNSQGRFLAAVDFNSDADVDVPAGAFLNMVGVVNFDTVNAANNAEFTGAGIMAFSNVVNVNEAVTINMVGGTVDLDGNDATGEFINIDAPMTINAATASNFGRVNSSGGVNTLDVNNSVGTGVLTVNLDSAASEWTLNGPGVMNLVNDNTDATLLAGSDVNINGTVNVTGDVRTTARLDIAGVININTAAQPLRLAGGTEGDPNVLAGGTISGPGILGADTGKALHGFGTINTQVDFDGSSNLFADNGTLTVNGAIIDVSRIGTDDVDGTLNVVNAWNTSVASFVTLNGGTIMGGAMTIDNANAVSGFGTIASRVINNTGIRSSGGTLVVQTAGNDNDWDGAANDASLHAQSNSTLELRDNLTFGFTGAVSMFSGGRVFTNGFALDFNPGSSLFLNSNGTFESNRSTDLGGVVTTSAGPASTIKVQNNFFLTFEATSTTTLVADLRLENNNIIIEQGATFSGSGALVVPDGSHMVAENLSDIGVLLQMQGALRPGNSNGIGRVQLLDYQQESTGELYVELTGTALNAFDRLVASGDVVLDGYLNIDIDEVSPGVPFVPSLGQTFNIITGNTLTGTFDYKDVSGMPAGLAFHLAYLGNAVQLQVVNKPFFAADFDDDGDVDLTDLAIWQGAFNLNQLGDANGDNKTDIDDWTIWRDQFGAVPGPFLGSSVPEPTSGVLVALGGVLGALRRRVRRSVIAVAAVVIGVAGLNSTASAMPTLTVANGGLSGSNRLWHVQVAPDPALFNGGQGSVAVELSLELTVGQLVNVTKNAAAWPFDLPTDRDPFGLPNNDGLVFSLATDKVFAALGSNLFNVGTPVTVLTLETQGSATTTLHWGGQSVGTIQLSRIAQGGVAFNGYQGTLTLGGVPGDFDFDGDLDAIDIELLFDAVQGAVPPANALYDLNNNGFVNTTPNSVGSDADVWVRTLKDTEYGDANLDGQVDITDLAALATNWQTAAIWSGGDFNGSGFVDITDLAMLATNWQFGVLSPPLAMAFEQALASVGLGDVAVPEPTAALILLGNGILLARRRMP